MIMFPMKQIVLPKPAKEKNVKEDYYARGYEDAIKDIYLANSLAKEYERFKEEIK